MTTQTTQTTETTPAVPATSSAPADAAAANRERIGQLYAAFGAGDVPAVLAMLDPDIVWRNAGPADLPYFGTRRGAAAVGEVFEIIGREFEIHDFSPSALLAEADLVVAVLHQRTTIRSTGRTFEEDLVHVWRLGPDGLVVELTDVQDSWVIAAAMRG
jgi:uncharacterized protein